LNPVKSSPFFLSARNITLIA